MHSQKGGNMDVKEIKEKIKAANVDSLRVDFPDLHGICRSNHGQRGGRRNPMA
jgi:hypothetical protein